jgi:hypothetical protein
VVQAEPAAADSSPIEEVSLRTTGAPASDASEALPESESPAPMPAASPIVDVAVTDSSGQNAVEGTHTSGNHLTFAIDEPRAGERLSGYRTITGWAADLLPGGPGIDPKNVQVWIDGAQGSPLGFAQYGWQRDDVAGMLGDTRFAQTGFRLGWDTCTFPPGDYHIVVYGWRQDTSEVGLTSVDVTVEPCALAAGSVLLADPLDSANQLWPTGANDECAHRYQGGEYRVLKLAPNAAEDCAPPDVERTVYGDFTLEVDVQLRDPSPSAFATIGFRVDVAELSSHYMAGYAVRLNPVLGTVSLVHDVGPTYTRLAETRPGSLRAGEATNRVQIVAEGPRLTVLVNWEPALEVYDDRHPWGTVALGAGAPRGESAEAAFRNLVIRRP